MAQQPFPQHAYSLLDQSRGETRVFQYQGVVRYDGVFTLSFKCKVISLLAPPNFVAMSYPWGDGTDLRPILIDDSVTHISRNLDLALRDLRSCIEGQLLWSDAISINQRDDQEKSYQILQLPNIYAQADRVLIWPGPGCSQLGNIHVAIRDLAQAHTFLEDKMTDMCQMLPNHLKAKPAREKEDRIRSIIFKELCGKFTEGIVDSLTQFFAMPWWKRVWILQEYALAREIAFVCGNAMMDRETLELALLAMQYINRLSTARFLSLDSTQISAFGFCSSRCRALVVRHAYRQAVFDPEQTSLIRLLSFTSIDRRFGKELVSSGETFFKSSDHRDRVFGLLSIASDRERVAIRPDYSKSKNDVFMEAARSSTLDGRLSILSMRTRYDPDRELPSWAPDWTKPIEEALSFDDTVPEDEQPFKATRKMRARILPSSPEVLSLRAFLVDNIVLASGTTGVLEAEDVFPDGRERMRVFYQSALEMHASFAQIKIESDTQFEEFAFTSLGGRVWDPLLPGYIDPNVPTMIWAFQMIAGWSGPPNKNVDLDVSWLYMLAMTKKLLDRQFICLSDGRVALAPGRASVGDSIYLIPGADVPFVLRPDPSANGSGRFEVIGEAYVHGIMRGEFLDKHPDLSTIHLV